MRSSLRYPVGQSRLLIVEEETAVLDRRRALDLLVGENKDVLGLLGRYIGPEVPRTDTNLLTNVIDAVDSTSRIATSND
jgi:hypothetical protein